MFFIIFFIYSTNALHVAITIPLSINSHNYILHMQRKKMKMHHYNRQNIRLMKHKLLLLLCAFFVLAQETSAQTRCAKDKGSPSYKHEWRFGVAGYPIIDQIGYTEWEHDKVIRPGISDIDRLYKDYHGPRKMIGLASAEYSYNQNKHLSFAIGGYASAGWESTYDYMNRRKGTNAGFNISIVPTVRWKYFVRDRFSMYGSFGLGASFGYFDEWNLWPTFQFVPLGLTFGGKVYGFAEYGAGLLYIGGAAGIGYRF